MSDHESGALHKSIVDALYPECTLCNEKFDSVLDFGRHAAVFYHVKVLQHQICLDRCFFWINNYEDKRF